MLKVSTVLFDLDGTLTDSAPGIVASYRHALNAFGLDAEEEAIRGWIGPPLMKGLAALGVPDEQIPAAIDTYRRHFSAVGMYDNYLYPGVVDMLAALSSAGITLAVATSKLEHFARTIVDHFEIARYFTVVAGGSRDGTRLYKLDIARYALGCLGSPEPGEVALVGDREDDVGAAVQLGLHAVGVTWGYGSVGELTGHGADYLVDTPADVVELLDGTGIRHHGEGSGVYKILLPEEWERFEASGRFDGSPLDLDSGFVHCSSRSQVAATAERYFSDEPSIVLLEIDTVMLGETLLWETAPSGELFPHVYGPIPRNAVVRVHRAAGAAGVDGAIGRSR